MRACAYREMIPQGEMNGIEMKEKLIIIQNSPL
jgi:hypothetical protein